MRKQTRDLTKRTVSKVGEVSKTDQSYKKSSDINVMMKKFNTTGILPHSNKTGIFADVSNVKTLDEMFKLSTIALEAFQELPARVRKLMNNDASKLESFIADADNYDICVEHGLLIEDKSLENTIKRDVNNDPIIEQKASQTTETTV